jgi:hypothetical protein
MQMLEMTRWVPIQSTPNIQDCSPFGSANFTEAIPPWRDYQALAVKYYPADRRDALDALYLR